jgi:hypothetical protein
LLGKLVHSKQTDLFFIGGVVTGNSDFYYKKNGNLVGIPRVNPAGTFGNPITLLSKLIYIDESYGLFLDKFGNPIKGLQFGIQGQTDGIFSPLIVSPCGDIYGYGTNIKIQNNIYKNPSYFMKLSSNNCIENCSYLYMNHFNQNAICSNDTNFNVPIIVQNNMKNIDYKLYQSNTFLKSGQFNIENNVIKAHIPDNNVNYNIVLIKNNNTLYDSINIKLNTFDSKLLDSTNFTIPCDFQKTITPIHSNLSNTTWSINIKGIPSINSSKLNFNELNNYFTSFEKNKNYTVLVSAKDNNQCELSQNFSVDYCKSDSNSMKINKLSHNNIEIYPNPSTSYIQILLPTEKEFHYSLCDIHSKEIKKGNIQNVTKERIDLTSLSAGFYLLKIFDGFDFITIPITKE